MDPTIKYTNRNNDTLTFCLKGVNVSIVNSLRRTIISDIPVIVFRTMTESSNKCTIHENTSRLHNEIIKQRLSCIPIHISDVENFPYTDYSVELNVENTSSDIIIVTTEDFTMNDLKKDKKVSTSEVRQIFPPFTTGSGEYFIDLLRLRPSNNSNLTGEKIHLTCLLDEGTAKENGMFNVVSSCSYGFTVDGNKVESELQ